jgi:hypothetical protein
MHPHLTISQQAGQEQINAAIAEARLRQMTVYPASLLRAARCWRVFLYNY